MKGFLGILIVIGLGVFSCTSNKETTVKSSDPCVASTEDNCVCATNYEPVCGCDNKTYHNACHAKCSNVTYVAGKCEDKE